MSIKTDAEINRLVGERAFGFWVYHYSKGYASDCYYVLLDAEDNHVVPFERALGIRTGYRQTEAEAWADVPDYCNDPAAWGALFVWLAERGHCPRFVCETESGNLYTAYLYDETANVSGFGQHAQPGRALALAFLRAKGLPAFGGQGA